MILVVSMHACIENTPKNYNKNAESKKVQPRGYLVDCMYTVMEVSFRNINFLSAFK